MKHSRYKYFSNIDFAHQFLVGKVFHQTLGYFRDYEDGVSKQVIGDEYESTRIYRPVDGLQVNNRAQGMSFPLQMCPNKTVSCADNNGNVLTTTVGSVPYDQNLGSDLANRLTSITEGANYQTYGLCRKPLGPSLYDHGLRYDQPLGSAPATRR